MLLFGIFGTVFALRLNDRNAWRILFFVVVLHTPCTHHLSPFQGTYTLRRCTSFACCGLDRALFFLYLRPAPSVVSLTVRQPALVRAVGTVAPHLFARVDAWLYFICTFFALHIPYRGNVASWLRTLCGGHTVFSSSERVARI